MIAFDPDQIDIKQDYTINERDNPGPSIELSYQMSVPKQSGTAYIRITPQIRDFLMLCHEKHGVVGFEYDFDEAGLNFGIVLKENEDK